MFPNSRWNNRIFLKMTKISKALVCRVLVVITLVMVSIYLTTTVMGKYQSVPQHGLMECDPFVYGQFPRSVCLRWQAAHALTWQVVMAIPAFYEVWCLPCECEQTILTCYSAGKGGGRELV